MYFCLGVKFALYEGGQTEDYQQRIRAHYVDEFTMVPVEPCCARKLVQDAAQYALNLGFPPHPDYKKASRMFSGVDTSQCRQEFKFA